MSKERGPDQTVKIIPAKEFDRAAAGRVGPDLELTFDSGPIRCQAWGEDGMVFVRPVQIIDGVATDFTYTPKEQVRIDRLAFVYGGKVFVWYLPQEITAKRGQPIQFALAHLKLVDKFMRDVLG